jgi:uncharacterized protein (TIGR02118 family)
MVKFTMCLHRLPHLTPEEFHAYWYEKHGPLVRSLAPVLNIRRYVQVHALDRPINEAFRKSRGAPPRFDGIAEVWYDGLEAFEAPFATAEGREAGRKLKADEARFIDLSRSPGWIGEEKPILE